jgi:UDPglucose 6-dehydrogenase
MKEFGVIGLGSVGWSVIHGLSQYYSYAGYDILNDYKWEPILDTKLVFVCVGTPSGKDGRLDCNNVYKVLKKLFEDRYKGIVVVKSTVSIGFMDCATKEFPGLRLVYMPEFLREKNSYTWFIKPDRIVISGEQEDIDEVLSYFSWVENATIIKTDFKNAEIGKLAHNSYIATKVSFTNEIENICRPLGADAFDVMRIVWTDRRVACSEHLTPGLGPYGGKCVLKDMNELTNSTHSDFLASVRKVNDSCTMHETINRFRPVIVIIPTLNRPLKLQRALSSIVNQTYRPKLVVVVNDPEEKVTATTGRIVQKFSQELPIKHLVNDHSKNISGAINAGLEYIRSKFDIDDCFIALLDDDDWWDRKYLENCIKFAQEYDSDWVISGLVRHDNRSLEGCFQTIPDVLSLSRFLVTNPNIQNSNLFIKADKLMAIGGYDENLVSTTDRDVCIRLLQLPGIRYSFLRNHLVHHDASDDPGRLSCPGSLKKTSGLNEFYHKYSRLMTVDQRIQFKERAMTLFRVEIQEAG